MFCHSRLLRFTKNGVASHAFNSKSQNMNVDLRLQSFVRDDVDLGLKYLSLFAFKLNLHLAFRNNIFETKTHTGEEQTFSACVLNHGQALIKTCNDLHQSSKRKRKPKSKQIITVLRSPFIYKKTREQFAFFRHNVTIKLVLTFDQAQWLLPMLSQLRLPCELKIFTRAQS